MSWRLYAQDSDKMRGQLRRIYWAVLVLLSLFIGYEALTKQVYGDNSFWLAVVFFGVALLSCARLASVGRTENRKPPQLSTRSRTA